MRADRIDGEDCTRSQGAEESLREALRGGGRVGEEEARLIHLHLHDLKALGRLHAVDTRVQGGSRKRGQRCAGGREDASRRAQCLQSEYHEQEPASTAGSRA